MKLLFFKTLRNLALPQRWVIFFFFKLSKFREKGFFLQDMEKELIQVRRKNWKSLNLKQEPIQILRNIGLSSKDWALIFFLWEDLGYLKTVNQVKVCLFLSKVWNSKIYDLEWSKKNYAFFIMFNDFRFGLWIFTKHLTYTCLKCFFFSHEKSH